MEFATRTLGEICDEVDGVIQTGPFGSQLHQSDYRDEGTPVVMPKDLADDRVSVESIARIGEEDVERLARHKLETGDIVYARRGDIGRRALITSREAGWMCGTGCMRISLGDTILNPRFLFYYLGQPDVVTWIYNQAVGATMPNLNTSIVRSIPVKHPPLPTQRKIAAVLSAYDDLIENNTRRIAVLEEMARLLYQEWFVRFRFPGHEDVAMADSELGSVPEGWEVCTLGEHVTLDRGLSYSGKYLDDDGIPMVNLKNISPGGGFRRDGTKYYAGPYKPRHIVEPDDLVFANTDLTQAGKVIGSPALVPPLTTKGQIILSHHLYAVRPKANSSLSRYYLYHSMLDQRFKAFAKGHASGTTVLGFRADSVLQFPVCVPVTSLIEQFEALAQPIYQLTESYAQRNDTLRRTRDLLLPRLVSGQVDVSELEIDVGGFEQ